jgi:hypothetical protein
MFYRRDTFLYRGNYLTSLSTIVLDKGSTLTLTTLKNSRRLWLYYEPLFFCVYMLRPLCMDGHTVYTCIPAPTYVFQCSSKTKIKSKFKMSMFFLDQNFMFFPMVHLKSKIMDRNMDTQLFTETAPEFNLHLRLHIGRNLADSINGPFEIALHLIRFYIYFIFVHDFCL